jgi:hypothetical protein
VLLLLVYGLYPVRGSVEGVGTIEPVFEDLILITSHFSGIVTRMRVELLQEVAAGAPLFEYIPEGQWSVTAYGGMSRPSGSPPVPPALEPEWRRAERQRHAARRDAIRRWSKRLMSPAQRALTWEHVLQQRLNAKVDRETDVAMEAAQAAENVRRGRQDANLPNVFDRGIGMWRATEDGEPFPSAVGGLVYSLWVRQRSQFSPAAALGEIWRSETPLEVFGLVPIPPAPLRDLAGWRASLTAPGERTPEPLPVGAIVFGRIPIDAGDAQAIFPGLPITRDSVFVRLTLAEPPARERLGAPLIITLTSPARPRVWHWLARG